jgi:site-specific recombinase XerD
MEDQGFTDVSTFRYLRVWRSVYNFALSRGIEFYSAELAELYMQEKYQMAIGENSADESALSPYLVQIIRGLRALTDFKLHGFVPKMTRGEIIDWPEGYRDVCLAFIEDYRAYGFEPATCRQHELNLCRFAWYLDSRGINLESIDATHVYDYFITMCHLSKPTLSTIRVIIVKSLRYFYKRGLCPKDLSNIVPKVHYHAKAKLTKVWSEEEVFKMLKAIDRANPTGKRDYAIMAIAANLGLRTGDIVNLSIDNFDWRNGAINIVQGKTGEPLSLPISEQIGKAVIDYWRNGRPQSVARELFIQHTLPYMKLSSSMAYHIFNKYYFASGFKLDGRRHGLHSLRHSLASRLLEKDTPVNVIGNILGHVDSNSASNYIRIDVNQLRKCALEVPEVE